MTIKKSLLAVATASTVAFAGAGIANAQDTKPETGLSSTSSLEGSGARLSSEAAGTFGSADEEGNLTIGAALAAAGAVAGVATAVSGLLGAPAKIQAAIEDFQEWGSQFLPN